MKKSYIEKVVCVVLSAAILLCGCGGSNEKGKKEADKAAVGNSVEEGLLRIAMEADITTMDVHKTSVDYLVPMNIFDTLFKVVRGSDGTTSIVGSLAEDYEVSEDGLTYSFKLLDGVEFSDGTPLTANDVKYTFERLLTLPDSQQVDYGLSIEGAEDLMSGKEDELKGIDVTDDTHFSIKLSHPYSGFLAELATPSTSIYSESIVTEAGEDFGTDPGKTLGTGPYVVTKWERGVGIDFSVNPNYWGQEPSVKKVSARIMDASSMDMAFQKGDLDILDCLMIDSALVESIYNKKYADDIVSVDRMGLNYFSLNQKIEPLNNLSVRKAIQMAIDRKSILDSIYGGDGKLEDGIYPSGCLGYSEENQGWLEYNPKEAKKLLEEAGYSDGFEMEIALDSDSTDANKNVVQIMAQNLEDVGIHANIKSYDHASWLDLRNSGNMESFLVLWMLDFNDPDNIIYTFFGREDNTVIRSNNYPDSDVMAQIAAARGIVDQDERMAEYAKLEKKLVQEDAVWVPLFSLKHLFVKGERVEDFVPHWAGWSDMYFSGVALK